MKRISFILAALAAATASAQLDNVVEVENSYQPVVKDANKINVLPEVQQPPVKHYKVDYDGTSLPTSLYAFQPMWAAQSDADAKGTPRDFLTLGGGTQGRVNLRGAYGLSITDDDLLDFDFSLRGHNGKVETTLHDDVKWKQRFYTTRGAVGFEHKFNHQSSLLLKAAVESQVFNHSPELLTADGDVTATAVRPWHDYFDTDKQHNLLGDFAAIVTPYSFRRFDIGADVGFDMFSQQYRTNFFGNTDDKPQEFQVHGGLSLAYRLPGTQKIGLDLEARSISYSYDEFDHLFSASIKPHIDLAPTQNIDLRLGAILYFTGGFESKFRAAPDVSLQVHATPSLDVFATATGGEVRNDFRHFACMTPYWMHSLVPARLGIVETAAVQFGHQFDRLRLQGGVNWNVVNGLFLKLYGGYDLSKNRAELLGNGHLFAADGSLVHINADLTYDYQDVFHVNVQSAWNGWQTDAVESYEDDAVSWRPTLQLNADARYRIVPRLFLRADMLLQTFKSGSKLIYERPTTLDVGASISYKLPIPQLETGGGGLSIYVSGDNLLNRNDDAFNMVRATGISVMGGAAWTF